jgi:hypothetical protein
MHLGFKQLTSGDTRRCVIDYRGFLAQGEKLTLPVVTVPTGTVSSIGSVAFDVDDDKVFVFVIGGTLTGERFTANVQVKTTFNQTINDTLVFDVVSP